MKWTKSEGAISPTFPMFAFLESRSQAYGVDLVNTPMKELEGILTWSDRIKLNLATEGKIVHDKAEPIFLTNTEVINLVDCVICKKVTLSADDPERKSLEDLQNLLRDALVDRAGDQDG